MAVNGKVFTMEATNSETLGSLLGQLGTLLGVPKRDDGMYYLADMCQSANINPWAKYKPFRYAAWNFASKDARDTARKGTPNTTGISHGLKLPMVRHMITLSSNNDRWTYLVAAAGSKMMNMSNPDAPDYQYLQIQGGESEPNRLRDFDGYDHNLPMMPIWKAGIQYIQPGTTQKLNRFSSPVLRFYIMANPKGGAHLTLEDIIQSSNNMRFVVEEMDDTASKPYYQWTKPSKLYVSDNLAKDIDQTGQFIDVELDPANDGKKISFVWGINEINPSNKLPYEANGIGLFAPSSGGLHWVEFNQVMEFSLLLKPLRFATGAATPSWISLPNSTYTKTTSSDIIVEMQVQKGNGYYITGADFTGSLPSGAINYRFKFMNTSSSTAFADNVVGIISNSAGQSVGTKYVYIERKSSLDPNEVEYQTIYLRFNNVMTKAGNYTTGRLMGSPDGGASWGEITSGNAGLTLYITRQ